MEDQKETKQSDQEIQDIVEKLEEQNLNQKEEQTEKTEDSNNNNGDGDNQNDEIDDNSVETIDKIDKLQSIMNKALEIVGLYKNEIDDLKTQIGDMKEIILQRDQQDKERVAPIITQLSQIYREEFSKLIDENKHLEDELVTVIKEKQEVIEEIYSCVDKIKLLEQSVFKGELPPYLKKKLELQKEQQEKVLKQLENN